MKYKDISDLTSKLRSVTSRSKGQLLCEAADTIEKLTSDLKRARSRAVKAERRNETLILASATTSTQIAELRLSLAKAELEIMRLKETNESTTKEGVS